jgi:hypothetical protein
LAARGAGLTSKLHCLADALGRPLAFDLMVGEAADCKAYDALIDLPECTPDALLADKGYDANAIRADLAKRNIEPLSMPDVFSPKVPHENSPV